MEEGREGERDIVGKGGRSVCVSVCRLVVSLLYI